MDIILQEPTLIFALLFLGTVAGFLAGLLGIGGGVILVPGLYAIFKMLGISDEIIMHMALGTSLAIIVPTGLSSAHAHWKKRAVDWHGAKRIGLGVIIGSSFGVFLANQLSGANLSLIFSIAIIILAGLMLARPERLSFCRDIPKQPWSGLAGIIIGLISSLIGIGGATLSVPYMSLCRVSIHRAIGTAAALGLFIAIPATIGFIYIGWLIDAPPYSLGFVYLPAWFLIVMSSVFSARLGVTLAHKVPVEKMRKGFALFMVLIAVKMTSGFFL